MKPPIVFIRFEAANSKNAGSLGSSGDITDVGTVTYSAGRFGNGMYTTNNANYCKIASFASSNVNNWQKYTLEAWINTNWNCANGAPSAGYPTFFRWIQSSPARRISCRFFDVTYGLGYECDGDSGSYQFYNTNASLDFSSGALNHLAIVVNSAGIGGGSNKIAWYLNGSAVGTSTVTVGAVTGTGDLTIGAGVDGYNWNGLIDNLKIYDYEKTDFSDRWSERGGMRDQTIIL